MAKRKFILKEQERKELRRAGSQTDKVPDLQRLSGPCVWRGKARSGDSGHGGRKLAVPDGLVSAMPGRGGTGLASKYQGQNAAKLARQQRWDLVEKLNQYRRERPFPRRYGSPKANDPEAGGGEPAAGSQTDPRRVEERWAIASGHPTGRLSVISVFCSTTQSWIN